MYPPNIDHLLRRPILKTVDWSVPFIQSQNHSSQFPQPHIISLRRPEIFGGKHTPKPEETKAIKSKYFTKEEWNDYGKLMRKIEETVGKINKLIGWKHIDLHSLPEEKKISQAFIKCNSPPDDLDRLSFSPNELKLIQEVRNKYIARVSENIHLQLLQKEYDTIAVRNKAILETYSEYKEKHRQKKITTPLKFGQSHKSTKRQKLGDTEHGEPRSRETEVCTNDHHAESSNFEFEIPISQATIGDELRHSKNCKAKETIKDDLKNTKYSHNHRQDNFAETHSNKPK